MNLLAAWRTRILMRNARGVIVDRRHDALLEHLPRQRVEHISKGRSGLLCCGL